MSGHTPLTAIEITRRQAIILPLRKGGMTIREIAAATEFTVKQIEGSLYRKSILARCQVESSHCIAIPLRSRPSKDFLLDREGEGRPRMADTGKRCARCKKIICKMESYQWCSERGGYCHERECKTGTIYVVDTAPQKW